MVQRDDDDGYSYEDYGQVDGEGNAGVVQFVPNRAQPWLRTPNPPWHMWGTTETVRTQSVPFAPPTNASQQLVKINYKRPETWHWLFYIRLIAAPNTDISQFAQTTVHFDLTVGLGRASVTIPAFESFTIEWNPSLTAPLGQVIYSTQVYGPNRLIRLGGTPATLRDNVTSEIVAQDIQVNARVLNGSNFVTTIDTEVGAFFAPKTHLRPDWFQVPAPIEARFPGDEIQGR